MRLVGLNGRWAGVALVAVAAVLVLPAPSAAESVERLEIVDRAIQFHGQGLYGSSVTTLDQCSRAGCSKIRALQRGGMFDHEVEGAAGEVTRRVHATNDTVRRWDDGEEVSLDAEGERRARDWVNSKVYFPFLPYRLNDGSTFKQDMGLERWGDRQLHKVKVTFEAGSSSSASDEYVYWFDPESGRLEQFAYSFGSGEGAGVRFRRLFNYRRVGGILFADQDNLGASAPDIRVDVVTPEFVEETMQPVSSVTFRDISVRGLR